MRLVVPTIGDRPDYLELCLTSIRNQIESVELVIVGPATAASRLREVADRHSCRFLTEEHRGLSNAINQGWRGAETEYVAWLGDDDMLTGRSLSAACDALERNPTAAMVYGRFQVIDVSGRPLYVLRPGTFASWFAGYGQNFMGQPGSVYRREAVERVGMLDPALRYAMDFDLHLRLRKWGGMLYLPQVLGCFRVHATSLTVTNQNPELEQLRVMRRYLGPKAQRLELLWWPLARVVSQAWGLTAKSGVIESTARKVSALRCRAAHQGS
ncbi:glycosyltransferase [Streptomyces sp. NPDC019396]|uniref:glycosyltransferase n=1 Tax=Streptomyces sp. NPDC019396 TaxID=3154687 RepID=UPI0033F297F3